MNEQQTKPADKPRAAIDSRPPVKVGQILNIEGVQYRVLRVTTNALNLRRVGSHLKPGN